MYLIPIELKCLTFHVTRVYMLFKLMSQTSLSDSNVSGISDVSDNFRHVCTVEPDLSFREILGLRWQ